MNAETAAPVRDETLAEALSLIEDAGKRLARIITDDRVSPVGTDPIYLAAHDAQNNLARALARIEQARAGEDGCEHGHSAADLCVALRAAEQQLDAGEGALRDGCYSGEHDPDNPFCVENHRGGTDARASLWRCENRFHDVARCIPTKHYGLPPEDEQAAPSEPFRPVVPPPPPHIPVGGSESIRSRGVPRDRAALTEGGTE